VLKCSITLNSSVSLSSSFDFSRGTPCDFESVLAGASAVLAGVSVVADASVVFAGVSVVAGASAGGVDSPSKFLVFNDFPSVTLEFS